MPTTLRSGHAEEGIRKKRMTGRLEKLSSRNSKGRRSQGRKREQIWVAEKVSKRSSKRNKKAKTKFESIRHRYA